MNILAKSNCFHDFQFMFWLNFLTNTEVLSIIESIQNKLYPAKYADDVSADLKIAFYTLDQDTLVNKLEYYEVRGETK